MSGPKKSAIASLIIIGGVVLASLVGRPSKQDLADADKQQQPHNLHNMIDGLPEADRPSAVSLVQLTMAEINDSPDDKPHEPSTLAVGVQPPSLPRRFADRKPTTEPNPTRSRTAAKSAKGVPSGKRSRSAAVRDQTARPLRHVIADGDTLESLAKWYLGDPGLASQIFEANQRVLQDPHLLPISTPIVIPARQTSTYSAKSTNAETLESDPPLTKIVPLSEQP